MGLGLASVESYAESLILKHGYPDTADIGEIKPKMVPVLRCYLSVDNSNGGDLVVPYLVDAELERHGLPGADQLKRLPMEPSRLGLNGFVTDAKITDTRYTNWEVAALDDQYGVSVRYHYGTNSGLVAVHLGNPEKSLDELLGGIDTKTNLRTNAVGFVAVMLASINLELKRRRAS